MSRWQWQFAAVASAISVASIALSLFSDAANSGPAYPPLQDYYKGPYGFFTHYSAGALLGSDGKVPLAYAVCNVDPKDPLYFYWDTPAFGTGWYYPLQLGTCATLTRSAVKPTVDDKSLIIFTQHNEKWAAKAYVPDNVSQLPQDWFSQLVGFFTMPGSDPRIVNVSVRVVVDANKHVTYVLSWYQGTPDLAVGFNLDGLPSVVQQQILASLENGGVEAHFEKPSDFVSGLDRQHLAPKAAGANYLVMRPRPNITGVRFSYDTPTVQPATQPVIITDQDRRVVAIGSYGSAR